MWWRERYCRDDWLRVGRLMSILEHNFISSMAGRALSRISPRVRVRDSVSIVYRIAPGGYSWIWPEGVGGDEIKGCS